MWDSKNDVKENNSANGSTIAPPLTNEKTPLDPEMPKANRIGLQMFARNERNGGTTRPDVVKCPFQDCHSVKVKRDIGQIGFMNTNYLF